MKQDGKPESKKLSTGCSVAIILFILVIFAPDITSGLARNARLLRRCDGNLEQIYRAIQMYAADNAGFLPPENGAAGLNRLLPYNESPLWSCSCPAKDRPQTVDATGFQEAGWGYIYYGGGKLSDREPGSILIMDKPDNHPGEAYIVLYASGGTKRNQGRL